MNEHAVTIGPDGLARCPWAGADPLYLGYHDKEWGRPVRGEDALFERICLEAFQSGLAWITILRKREAFRAAFAGFAIEKVAEFDDADAARLLEDQGIVRNRAKINASIANARAARALDGGLTDLIWAHAPTGRQKAPKRASEIPAVTDESTALAKSLKKAGFVFVGPTTAYALMQACGLVNDHLLGCHTRTKK